VVVRGVVLVVPCVVWCCSCCVFVCVTCFFSFGDSHPHLSSIHRGAHSHPSSIHRYAIFEELVAQDTEAAHSQWRSFTPPVHSQVRCLRGAPGAGHRGHPFIEALIHTSRPFTGTLSSRSSWRRTPRPPIHRGAHSHLPSIHRYAVFEELVAQDTEAARTVLAQVRARRETDHTPTHNKNTPTQHTTRREQHHKRPYDEPPLPHFNNDRRWHGDGAYHLPRCVPY